MSAERHASDLEQINLLRMKKLFLITGLTLSLLIFTNILNGKELIPGNGFALQHEEKNKEKPLIFPIPLKVEINEGIFNIDKTTFIMVPEKNSNTDDFLAGLLFNEFADKYQQPLTIVKKSAFTGEDKFILIGDMTNPLVRICCEKNGLLPSLKELGPEGYILSVTVNNILVAANNKTGALFGLESLRQIINKDGKNISVPLLVVKDSPQYPFRGIKLYLPGRENIPFFKRFIKDFAALYKFNKIILELNANMRLERHPELNTGTIEFEKYLNFSRLDRPPGVHKEFQNSSHQDNADGEILEKEEVADLVNYIRKFNIEVIPELPSLTHSYYLLFGHRDLAENMNQPYPDTYCPLKPEVYKIYFDVLDEYIEVIHPSVIHVGHDEWRMEKDICELCRGKDYGQLYADDLTKIHDYLAKKGIITAIWGDHLLESVTKKDHQTWKSSTGYQYKIPGALTPDQVAKSIPKDIIIFNWFWDNINNDKQVSGFGFQQVYGNFRPEIDKWNERYKIKGVLGGAPSSWAATTEKNFGKDQILDFLGSSNLLWSGQSLPGTKLALITEALIGEIRNNLSGIMLPGDMGINIKPLNISSDFNSSLTTGIDSLNSTGLLSGSVKDGNKYFNLISSYQGKRAVVVATQKVLTKSASVKGIRIDSDVNSIIFLHACTKAARNEKAYSMIYNFDETAELLGWYEIIYEDGFVETIPIRYGVNILDWQWRQRELTGGKDSRSTRQNYVYNASAVTCSKENEDPVTFFSFEWENARYGKKITEINLKSVKYTKNNENAIILLAISISENMKAIEAKGIEKH
jgi:hypothetical protein